MRRPGGRYHRLLDSRIATPEINTANAGQKFSSWNEQLRTEEEDFDLTSQELRRAEGNRCVCGCAADVENRRDAITPA